MDEMGRTKKKNVRSRGMKNKIMATSSKSQMPSATLDCLPDELLIRILEHITPVNINDYITLIRLEMVSTRFRHCVVDNKKIWENINELVIGYHPDLPGDQYLYLFDHAAIESFLKRVQQKIQKVVICSDFTHRKNLDEKSIMSVIDHFIGKFDVKHLYLCDHNSYYYVTGGVPLITKVIQIAQKSLDSYHFWSIRANFRNPNLRQITHALSKCSSLKTVTISVSQSLSSIHYFLVGMKSFESLKFEGYDRMNIHEYAGALERFPNDALPFSIPIVRFVYPNPDDMCCTPDDYILGALRVMVSQHNAASIRELELHYCAKYNNLTQLRNLLDHAHLPHFKLTFLPYFKANKMQRIIEFFNRVIQKTAEEKKITLTFKHFQIDRDEKLGITHGLLDAFEVPHTAQHGGIWEFYRGMLCINLMMEEIDDQSVICHPYPTPTEKKKRK